MKLFQQKQFDNTGHGSGQNPDNKDKREDKGNPDFDENGLHKDLWPHRDEMKEWAKRYIADFGTFLEYKNARFNLIFGTGFYHEPIKGRPDNISLSVPYFKKCKESGKMTTDQIFFAGLHEFAHLKTMFEMDLAGKYNHLSQYNYEKRKKIRTKDDPKRFASLQPTYRSFYNITEDAIVNHLVLDTGHFGKSVGAESKRRNQEIVDLYTDKFFPLFKEAGEGNGSYIKNPDPMSVKEEPYLFVGEGKGDLEIRRREDYEEGFDWTEAANGLKRSGQFMTFFIKNQMIGIKKEDIATEENPGGKFTLHEDTSVALTKPLAEAYKDLLKKIFEKYKDDPGQFRRYMEFMSMILKVANWEQKGGKPAEGKPDFVPNVFPPAYIHRDKGKRARTIEDIRTDDKKLESILSQASFFYSSKVEDACRKVGLRDAKSATYLDIFNQFKKHNKAKEYSWTFPLKHNLAERTRIMRNVLEPIYTMLCVLDDSFDFKMPPETPPNGPPPPEKPQDPERPEWEIGDKVINRQDGSSNNGRVGVVIDRAYGPGGKITSVTVEYLNQWIEKKKDKMSQSAEESDLFGNDSEEVYDPYNNLRLYSEKNKSGQKQRKNDPRKIENVDEDQEDDDKDKDKEKDKNKNEDDNDEDDKEDENEKKDKNDDENQEDETDQDLEDIIDPYEKALRRAIEEEERVMNLKELEDHKKSTESKERNADREKAKRLLKKLKEEREKKSIPEPEFQHRDFSDKKIVEEYIKLEKKLAPYADKMAKHWLEVVKNIASKIEVVKDKYYRSGKVDIKKLQKHFSEIEMGADISDRLIYERIVEKVVTEIRPRMLRIVFGFDNSGSMNSKLDNMRMVIMLLNSSLRSLRVLFRNRIKDILGPSYREDMDLVCDTEMWTYGAPNNQKKIKSFDHQDLRFLDIKEGAKLPPIDIDKETIETMIAFQKLNVSERDTYDNNMWGHIKLDHDSEDIGRYLSEGKMTEVIFQISDGDMHDSDEKARGIINMLRDMHIGVGGFAVGSSKEEAEGAVLALTKRHGKKHVIRANSPQEIVDEFGELLKRIVREQIEKPMIDCLENLSERKEKSELRK